MLLRLGSHGGEVGTSRNSQAIPKQATDESHNFVFRQLSWRKAVVEVALEITHVAAAVKVPPDEVLFLSQLKIPK